RPPTIFPFVCPNTYRTGRRSPPADTGFPEPQLQSGPNPLMEKHDAVFGWKTERPYCIAKPILHFPVQSQYKGVIFPLLVCFPRSLSTWKYFLAAESDRQHIGVHW